MSLEEVESFTSDQVTIAIKRCRNSRAYGPDSLRIFYLTLYNYSLNSCQLPSICKTSLVIPIPKPGKESLQGTSYRPISVLCPATKVLDARILPSIKFLSPAKDHTKTLDYICPPPAHNIHRDRLQPAEGPTPYSVCDHRLIGPDTGKR